MAWRTTVADRAWSAARRPVRRTAGMAGLLAALALFQVACANFIALPVSPVVKAIITGKVLGDRLQDQQLGRTVEVPLLATVRCNQAATKLAPDGSYSLVVEQATQYICTASAPSYVTGEATLDGSLGQVFHLDFGGPTLVSACGAPVATPTGTRATRAATPPAAAIPTATATTTTAAALLCPELHLRAGSITGVVTNADNHLPATSTRITCWNAHTHAEDTTPTGTYTSTTDSTGGFAFASLPIDRYLCTAGSDPTAKIISPAPGAATTVAITICGKLCPSVRYQGGPVMHTMTAYVVFWLPSGYIYSAVGNDHFEGLIQRYFHDVGASSYYNIVTQYWDTTNGFMLNQVSLGDVYVDTHPYPRAATRSDPLQPSDLEREARAAIAARHWTADTSHAVFIYTGYNAQICDGNPGGLCTFPNGSQDVFCGYHSLSGQNLIFVVVATTQSCSGASYVTPYGSPNGDRLADEALITTSHEQFESATDLDTRGWWSGNASTGEIGDKCAQSYREVMLGGHPYWVQAEWSDRGNGCVFSL